MYILRYVINFINLFLHISASWWGEITLKFKNCLPDIFNFFLFFFEHNRFCLFHDDLTNILPHYFQYKIDTG